MWKVVHLNRTQHRQFTYFFSTQEIYHLSNSITHQLLSSSISSQTITTIPYFNEECIPIPKDLFPIHNLKENYNYKIYSSHRVKKFKSPIPKSWKYFHSQQPELIPSLIKHFKENSKVHPIPVYIQQNTSLDISIDGS